MARIKQKPEERSGEAFKGRNMVTHPAFGLVRVGRVSSSGTNLFDSDIDHSELIELTFHRAAIERLSSGMATAIESQSQKTVALLWWFNSAQHSGRRWCPVSALVRASHVLFHRSATESWFTFPK
ncbi:hypothetical protein CAC00_09575 [Raoultella ornithinolytica]|nr:hypothetical protein CAC00_09575 [Raoultella ornithinolytica]